MWESVIRVATFIDKFICLDEMSRMLTGKGLDARVVACGAGGLVQADTSHADVALEETRVGTRAGAASASDTHKWI